MFFKDQPYLYLTFIKYELYLNGVLIRIKISNIKQMRAILEITN